MENITEIIRKTSVGYANFLKKGWSKGILYKIGLLFLVMLLWPLALISLCWYAYHKFDKPITSWVAVAGVILVTLPLTLGWIGGITDRSPNNKTASTRTSSGSDCVGPDGKHIGLGKEDCEKFNNVWKNGQQAKQPDTTANHYVFDVPSLIGKDLDGIVAMLGTPKGQDPTEQQIQLGVTEWDKTFVKDGKELLVTYTTSNRKVVDFFISTDDPSGSTTDTEHLLQMGNLQENDPKYKVEFVKAIKNPSSFTGIKVIPN